MLNFGKKIALRATKKINILTLVMSEKKFLNETKNHNPPLPPPFKLNGRSLRQLLMPEKSNILTHLKLFETCVKPILVYCSEIWSLNIVKSNFDLESKY